MCACGAAQRMRKCKPWHLLNSPAVALCAFGDGPINAHHTHYVHITNARCFKSIVHEGWSFNSGTNDIAICYLDQDSDFRPVVAASGTCMRASICCIHPCMQVCACVHACVCERACLQVRVGVSARVWCVRASRWRWHCAFAQGGDYIIGGGVRLRAAPLALASTTTTVRCGYAGDQQAACRKLSTPVLLPITTPRHARDGSPPPPVPPCPPPPARPRSLPPFWHTILLVFASAESLKLTGETELHVIGFGAQQEGGANSDILQVRPTGWRTG